jgi:hypothetical protein
MAKIEVQRLKDKHAFTRHFGILDYKSMADVLREGDMVFVKNTKETPLKPQTMWKASNKLSSMVGKKVVAINGEKRENNEEPQKGYLFMVKEEEKKVS